MSENFLTMSSNHMLPGLYGLLVGDAVGTTNEFSLAPAPISDMVGGGPFDLSVGAWTDDGSMALALAYACRNGFDAAAALHEFRLWMRTGKWSSTGTLFDIGNTTRRALESGHGQDVPANGALMRNIGALLRATSADEAAQHSVRQGEITHANADSSLWCATLGRLCWHLQTHGKREAWALAGEPALDPMPLRRDTMGHVGLTFRLAFEAFMDTDDFKTGCLQLASLGHDSDTYCAVYGQMAGVFHGVPADWQARLVKQELIRDATGPQPIEYITPP